MTKAGWLVAVWAALGPALALAQAVPLVPIPEPPVEAEGSARAQQPGLSAPPLVEVGELDSGASPSPVPLVVVDGGGELEPVDSGAASAPLSIPSEIAGDDAGLEPDAGQPALPADGGASAPDAGTAPEPSYPDFVKGELSQYLGATRITVQGTRLGLGIGVNRETNILYTLLEPRFDLHLAGFGLGLAVPLNLEVYNANPDPAKPGSRIGTGHLGHFRKEDYQTARDFARVLQYLTYGKKEDHLYVNVGQIYAESLGHGEIMRRYQPNIDLDVVRIAAEVDAYNDYLGVELVTNDLLSATVLGGLLFVKPLALVSDNPTARSLSIGFTYAADRTAPSGLSIDTQSFAGSTLNGCGCAPRLRSDDGGKTFHLVYGESAVNLWGVDAELKVLKTANVDLKPFIDYSHLVGGDGGLTLGLLGRFNFGVPLQALRLVAELRYLGDRYRPEYFDTFYEVDRYIFLDSPRGNLGLPQSQQQAALGGFGSRAGYYLEVSYGMPGWFSTTIAIEGDTGGPAKNLIVHAELPKLFVLQLFGTYYKRGFTSFGSLGELDQNSVAFAGARVELLPILFINARAFQTFKLDTETTHTYQTTRGVEGDLELGWQF